MTEKITGYVLLIVGVGIILFSAWNVYAVFTKQIQPVQVFSVSGIGIDAGQLLGGNLPQGSNQKMEVIPAEILNQLLNLTAQIILMGFMGGIGMKLGSLGVMLLRPVTVKLRETGS